MTRSPFFCDMAPLYHFPTFRDNEVLSTWARAPDERHPYLHLRKPDQIFRFLFLLYYQSRRSLNRNARGLYSGGTRFELGYLVCWPRFLTVFLFLPVTYEKQYLIDLRCTNFQPVRIHYLSSASHLTDGILIQRVKLKPAAAERDISIRKQTAACSVLLTKYYSGDQIKKNEMGGARSTCRGEESCIKGFGGEA